MLWAMNRLPPLQQLAKDYYTQLPLTYFLFLVYQGALNLLRLILLPCLL